MPDSIYHRLVEARDDYMSARIKYPELGNILYTIAELLLKKDAGLSERTENLAASFQIEGKAHNLLDIQREINGIAELVHRLEMAENGKSQVNQDSGDETAEDEIPLDEARPIDREEMIRRAKAERDAPDPPGSIKRTDTLPEGAFGLLGDGRGGGETLMPDNDSRTRTSLDLPKPPTLPGKMAPTRPAKRTDTEVVKKSADTEEFEDHAELVEEFQQPMYVPVEETTDELPAREPVNIFASVKREGLDFAETVQTWLAVHDPHATRQKFGLALVISSAALIVPVMIGKQLYKNYEPEPLLSITIPAIEPEAKIVPGTPADSTAPPEVEPTTPVDVAVIEAPPPPPPAPTVVEKIVEKTVTVYQCPEYDWYGPPLPEPKCPAVAECPPAPECPAPVVAVAPTSVVITPLIDKPQPGIDGYEGIGQKTNVVTPRVEMVVTAKAPPTLPMAGEVSKPDMVAKSTARVGITCASTASSTVVEVEGLVRAYLGFTEGGHTNLWVVDDVRANPFGVCVLASGDYAGAALPKSCLTATKPGELLPKGICPRRELRSL